MNGKLQKYKGNRKYKGDTIKTKGKHANKKKTEENHENERTTVRIDENSKHERETSKINWKPQEWGKHNKSLGNRKNRGGILKRIVKQ